MARPRSADPFVRKTINVPAHVAASFEMLYFSPTHGKPQYGVWSTIVTKLIEEHVKQKKAEGFDVT